MDAFDPNDHTIDEVHQHLEENPHDLAAVLSAEQAGKNRTTLVADLEARAKAVPTPVDPPAVTVEPRPAPGLLDQFEVTPEGGHRRKG